MKNLIKTIIKFVVAVAGIGMILVVINMGILVAWMFQNSNPGHGQEEMKSVAEAIVNINGEYVIAENGREIIENKYEWGMLIDSSGMVIWSIHLPKDIPLKYTLAEVAGFSRWYLKDYPVSVWQHSDGIVVLGDAKDSYWKYNIEYDMNMLRKFPRYGIYILGVNGLLAFMLAIALGYKLYSSLKPLVSGIEKLESKEVTTLETTGMLGELADKINFTSRLLKRQEELLKKRDNARLNWIRGISHDVRTPLSMIMGYAVQIEEESSINDITREQAAIIKRQSIKIKNLVSDLNLVSQLEYDMQPLRKEDICIAEIIRDVAVTFLNDDLQEKLSIEIDLSTEAEKRHIRGDKILLGRAITNIIGNSIKHNENKVHINIEAKCNTTYYEIHIMDNGQGIDPKKLTQLKTLKTRSINSIKDKWSQGLGLLIVGKIIESHQGEWEIESKKGEGVTYIMKIPVN